MNDSAPDLPSALLQCPSVLAGAEGAKATEDADAEFSFETDHEALRGNRDYLALLKVLSLLQAQKAVAVKDLDRLRAAKAKALRDPLALVEQLQRRSMPELPRQQDVAQIPHIDWDKYQRLGVPGAAASLAPTGAGAKSRHASSSGAASPSLTTESTGLLPDPSQDSEAGGSGVGVGAGCRVEKNSRGQFVVRGRVFSDKKPKTFNQPWTPEEQKRLEELLVQHPSEDVEMERWKKIAAALGNRTAIQVQSRTQKYFLKLQKAGLPIPGRANGRGAKYGRYTRQPSLRSTSYGQKHSLASQKNSSFFPNLTPDVRMGDDDYGDEDEDEEAAMGIVSRGGGDGPAGQAPQRILNDNYYLEDEDVSEEEGVDEAARQTPAYQELMWLKRLRREKELEQQMGEPLLHHGFRCDGCNQDPIVGPRFQCPDCLNEDTVDFCAECAPVGIEVGRHKKEHRLKPVRRKFHRKPLVDQEYTHSKNYLDPNFAKCGN